MYYSILQRNKDNHNKDIATIVLSWVQTMTIQETHYAGTAIETRYILLN